MTDKYFMSTIISYFNDRRRAIVKASTFKVLATLVGFLLTYFFTGSKTTALIVVIVNAITVFLGFYFHERVWEKIKWQINNGNDSTKRAFVKTVTYKIVSFTIGFLTKWAIIGDLLTALSIGVSKNIITFILYYFHERIWDKISWGKKNHI
jgi:uncharacterized membrane protein